MRFRNDLLGLGRTFLLQAEGACALSNRPIAAHLLAGIAPKPSEEGWAAEQLHGWFLGDLTPYSEMRRLLGGTTIDFDGGGLTEERRNLAGRWFVEPPAQDAFAALERFFCELAELTEPPFVDVTLSGGRDSRASAAVATHYRPSLNRFRTNTPPQLETVIARQLMERLHDFGGYNDQETEAFAANGRLLWWENVTQQDHAAIHARARRWAEKVEGLYTAVSLGKEPPDMFSDKDAFIPSIGGMGGESAKAYYWSPNMASGAYARSLKRFREDIQTKIGVRLSTHPLTAQSTLPFIDQGFRPRLPALVYDAQREATAEGIHGYRFLDYWWLTNRLSAGANLGSKTVMPFLSPGFIAEAMQGSPMDRAQAGLLSRIVGHFRPEWAEVPYFDQMQNTVPFDEVRSFVPSMLAWEGELAVDFLAMLRDSPAFDLPYDRSAMIEFFAHPWSHRIRRRASITRRWA